MPALVTEPAPPISAQQGQVSGRELMAPWYLISPPAVVPASDPVWHYRELIVGHGNSIPHQPLPLTSGAGTKLSFHALKRSAALKGLG